MLAMLTPHPPPARSLALLVAALALMFAVCTAMYIARVIHTGDLRYFFVPGNLILAWMPLVFALISRAAYGGTISGRPLAVLAGMMWLLFLPNAPYVLTDLQHYRPTPLIPGWYDGTMLGAFAVTGLLLGVVSLYVMQSFVADVVGIAASWLFVLAALLLSGFGIYLGRVLRWNSWDVVTAPLALVHDIAQIARYPVLHGEAYVMTAVFATLFATAYAVFYAVASLGTAPQH